MGAVSGTCGRTPPARAHPRGKAPPLGPRAPRSCPARGIVPPIRRQVTEPCPGQAQGPERTWLMADGSPLPGLLCGVVQSALADPLSPSALSLPDGTARTRTILFAAFARFQVNCMVQRAGAQWPEGLDAPKASGAEAHQDPCDDNAAADEPGAAPKIRAGCKRDWLLPLWEQPIVGATRHRAVPRRPHSRRVGLVACARAAGRRRGRPLRGQPAGAGGPGVTLWSGPQVPFKGSPRDLWTLVC
jgi:hypothetical protein